MAEYRGYEILVNHKIDGLNVCVEGSQKIAFNCCTFKEAMKWVDEQHAQMIRKDPNIAELCDIRNEMYVLSDRLTKIIQEKSNG
jgi:hypothetical protein